MDTLDTGKGGSRSVFLDKLQTGELLLAGFAAAIAVGTLLLSLPAAGADGTT